MSSESLAAFRRHFGDDLGNLAAEHFKHDLYEADREKLLSASKSFGTWATIGSVVGLGLGIILAHRVRANRLQYFNALRAAEKPTYIQFANGRTEPFPDVTSFMKPTTLGDFAAYTLFATGGLFVFGELGGLAGSMSASRTISQDPEAKRRIENAFRRFRADALRKQAEKLELGAEPLGW